MSLSHTDNVLPTILMLYSVRFLRYFSFMSMVLWGKVVVFVVFI